jgi:hypothetical protein
VVRGKLLSESRRAPFSQAHHARTIRGIAQPSLKPLVPGERRWIGTAWCRSHLPTVTPQPSFPARAGPDSTVVRRAAVMSSAVVATRTLVRVVLFMYLRLGHYGHGPSVRWAQSSVSFVQLGFRIDSDAVTMIYGCAATRNARDMPVGLLHTFLK